MKNILVLGCSRAGKTTLTNRIKEEFNYNIINTSVLFNTLGKAYPQLEMNNKEAFDTSTFAPFIAHYFCGLALYSKNWIQNKFVADVELGIYDFDKVFPLIDEILFEAGKLKRKDEFIIIGLVNSATKEETYNNLKKYDTEKDWTYNYPDKALKDFCKDSSALNQIYNELFAKYNFLTYDTSGDRKQVFDKIIEDVKKENCTT